jgi:hypothetical protein
VSAEGILQAANHGEVVLPYAGTSGYSGSDTSEARARTEDANGATGIRQEKALKLLAQAFWTGLTWKELAEATGWHHGQASATFSNLHKAGKIARLADVRDRCKVYVMPEFALDRPTEAQGRPKVTYKQVGWYCDHREEFKATLSSSHKHRDERRPGNVSQSISPLDYHDPARVPECPMAVPVYVKVEQ